ncbi:hypothetical protein [Natranaerobius trueperi]|uniref:DUF7847 domain-containing protein n=1 Tax=Natranaerobius trueperi TaxID=759412 RepID=A0A226C2M5_9FIRM|nr:hypothetical protein [Natranaerobius trueperi]OWZ84657.1 hypothetical protein CDO51_02535 [Natranaerobius trueperi]
MVLKDALKQLQKNYKVIAIPLIIDILLLMIIYLPLIFKGVRDIDIGKDPFNFKIFTSVSIPPSITDVMDINFSVNEITNFNLGEYNLNMFDSFILSGAIIIIVVIFFILLGFVATSLVKAGFLGTIKDGFNNAPKASFNRFTVNAKLHFWNILKYQLMLTGVILLGILFMIILIFTSISFFDVLNFTSILSFVLGFGLFMLLILLVILILTILLVFTPYAIVDDNLPPIKAIVTSFKTVKRYLWVVLLHLLIIWLLTIVASIIVNIVGSVSIIVATLVFTPIGTYLIFIIYQLYRKLNEKPSFKRRRRRKRRLIKKRLRR